MAPEYAQEYCETLVDYAFDMLWLRNTCGVNHAEFIFVRLAEFLTENPELKGWFLGSVASTMADNFEDLALAIERPHGFVPSELIEYIAHVKKWPELEQLALSELGKHKNDQIYLAGRNLPSSILDAMQPGWEDKEFYPSLKTDGENF